MYLLVCADGQMYRQMNGWMYRQIYRQIDEGNSYNTLSTSLRGIKNSEPEYETEYMQSLKQFVAQEVFPAYVFKCTYL